MLPFGKYKNESIQEIYQKDKEYLQWLNKQSWFRNKFKTLHQQTSKQLTEVEKPIEVDSDTIVVYTDGGCPGNGSQKAKAGIGVYFDTENEIQMENISREIQIDTPTNNKAELIAIWEALKTCKANNIQQKIHIYTDSMYSLNCITVWYPKWMKENKLKNRKNIDLIQPIYELIQEMNVIFIHINAHTDLQDRHSLGNSKADLLATQCIS